MMSMSSNMSMKSDVEDAPATALIRYSRDTLLQFNNQNYDTQLTQKILDCLRLFKIDKGNQDSVLKTDPKLPNDQKIANKPIPLSPTSFNTFSPLNRPMTRSPTTPQTMPRVPMVQVNGAVASPTRTAPPKYQLSASNGNKNHNNDIYTPLKLSQDKVPAAGKENENIQPPSAKKYQTKTPLKKPVVTYQPKTPVPTQSKNDVRTPFQAISPNTLSSPTKSINKSIPSSPVSVVSVPQTPASPQSPTKSLSSSTSGSPKISPNKLETDPHRLQQRQKQIDYGYKTLGYIKYRLTVPKENRNKEQPKTPKKTQFCSKRSWDGQVKKWRRELHLWDPTDPKECEPYFDENLLTTLFEGTLEIDSIKKQLEEQVEELRVNGRLLLSPNDKHLNKLINKSASPADQPNGESSNTAVQSTNPVDYSDIQPNRILPSALPDTEEEVGDETINNFKQPIARVLVFSADC